MINSVGWLRAGDIQLEVRASDKSAMLELLARRLSTHGVALEVVHKALLLREESGSTGLGHGVALPHARLPGLSAPVCVFFRMTQAIPFDAPDEQPVDLVLGLLLPTEGPQLQLRLLAHIAGLLSESRFRDALRQARDVSAVSQLFAQELATSKSQASK
jgi:PTS system nitrogen regulatory IIA component